MEILLPGKCVENKFSCTNWGGEVFYTNVSYRIDGNKLAVTVDGSGIDDISQSDLLQFLQSNGVIDSSENWKENSARDTDGLTYLDETYTTFVFARR